MLEENIKAQFEALYSKSPEITVKAPGRINIIGEHTDYNFGYVLPAAINYGIVISIARNYSQRVKIYSVDFDQRFDFDLETIAAGEPLWLSLIKGIFHQLKDQVGGVDIAFGGDVPVGAGLSSSAALCCGTGLALSSLFGLQVPKWDLAKTAQKSEHEFAGVPCGIMDQFASLFGLEGHVLMLDCLSLAYQAIPVDLADCTFLLIDSNVKHQLNESEYNARSEECAQALQELQSRNPSVKTLRDVSLEQLEAAKCDEIWWKRAWHIVTENQRVLDMGIALRNSDMIKVGNLLNQGHDSEKNSFEITCTETDFLANTLQQEEAVLGARQVGGGFGGCILTLVKSGDHRAMVERVVALYEQQFGIRARNIPIQISQGCQVLDGKK